MGKKGASASRSEGRKLVEANKQARRDYEILDTHEAGIVLSGSEVKSVREGGISLRDSYIRLKGSECYLVGCHIAPYRFSRQEGYDPYRDRKLLLHRREIDRLGGQVQLKGLTLIPMKVYFNEKGRCKIELGVGRGKKLFDKRQDVKAKDARREMERAAKR